MARPQDLFQLQLTRSLKGLLCARSVERKCTPAGLGNLRCFRSNARVQLQALYNHRGEVASEKCLSAATFVRQSVRPGHGWRDLR